MSDPASRLNAALEGRYAIERMTCSARERLITEELGDREQQIGSTESGTE